jgi:hypothetical protein
MARGIAVYREASGEALFDEPLGGEDAVRRWWSVPAAALGLPRLAEVYERGFYQGVRWSGPALAEVRAELARLEAHRAAAGLPPEVAADLAGRTGSLRAALDLAESYGGCVCIT